MKRKKKKKRKIQVARNLSPRFITVQRGNPERTRTVIPRRVYKSFANVLLNRNSVECTRRAPANRKQEQKVRQDSIGARRQRERDPVLYRTRVHPCQMLCFPPSESCFRFFRSIANGRKSSLIYYVTRTEPGGVNRRAIVTRFDGRIIGRPRRD